ncbi:MAG: anti-sigma factor [Salinisphaera sp.]|jgi:anti-sigma-K factor RskA|nr:anti-sigma factor [Salinisphaera sp.]
MTGSDKNSDLRESSILDAAEYVLGTLDAETRRQVERDMATDAGLSQEVAYWQDRLGVLGLSLEPVEPPDSIWQSIARRTGINTVDAQHEHDRVVSLDQRSAREKSAPEKRSRSRVWQGLAVAASVAAVVMAALLFSNVAADRSQSGQPAYASVLYDKPTGMSWLVTASRQPHKLSVMAMGSYPLPQGKVLRLWLEPENGKVVFLGKWPDSRGEHTLKMPEAVAAKLAHAKRLMVTMEDAGTAPGAGPFKRLMWVSPVARRTG